jgi:hypothetical protein
VKASFSKGFVKKQFDVNRSPIVIKIENLSFGSSAEVSIPMDHSEAFFQFMVLLTMDRDPLEAFNETFRKAVAQS